MQMINPEQRLFEAKRQSFGECAANKKTAQQSGATRDSDQIDLPGPNLRPA